MINFYKMQALGNDFVIIDNTKAKITFTSENTRFLCDRRLGIGCDQLIIIEEIKPRELVKMAIFNSDGSKASACGNATRSVGLYSMQKYQTTGISIKTDNRIIPVKMSKSGLIVANMGPANFAAQDIPLQNTALNPSTLDFSSLGLKESGFAVNVGNPHVVFIVPDVNNINLADIGPKIETHTYFPDKTNVEFVQVINKNTLRMRVWERGTGITLACGTGATATFAVANKLGIVSPTRKASLDGVTKEHVKIILDGGTLLLEFDSNQNIILEGPSTLVFEGKIEL